MGLTGLFNRFQGTCASTLFPDMFARPEVSIQLNARGYGIPLMGYGPVREALTPLIYLDVLIDYYQYLY